MQDSVAVLTALFALAGVTLLLQPQIRRLFKMLGGSLLALALTIGWYLDILVPIAAVAGAGYLYVLIIEQLEKKSKKTK